MTATQTRGPRVVLTPLAPSDLPWLVRWEHDPEVARYAGRRFRDGAEAWAWWRAAQADRRRAVLAIRTPAGQLIGDVELVEINWARREAELRIRIGDRAYRGRGLGRAAVEAAARYAAGVGLQQLFLRVDVRNVAALRCYRAAGFRCLARLRAGRRKADGLADMYLMARPLAQARAAHG
ncbi:GCN5-related N-acetyltransferase [Thermaerobacter marianensis DSM 12885]|uniref:GCN5-related N-acetyltransferase n=1 Tax=Thermaerobacter marianensis (strain ATCC 700841 / DSM 12885 / JCM 10246 / 7p75a) TaxID=644966 RepID=E6SKE4_THEM7|nr:GNAT family N-acetyltransferase [Thermaerobacter marianensis]ADU52302.1 GCN5-related N-acetyltransferase [Thermaerobacter marianensis DSM 12885]